MTTVPLLPWTMELDPPTLLRRYGLRHDSIQEGTVIKVTGVRAISGFGAD